MMQIVRSSGLASMLAAVPMMSLAADGPKLDVRLGLWETTTTVAHSGAPGNPAMPGAAAMPPGASEKMAEAMQNMPPEQRAKLAAAMSQMGQQRGGPHAHTYRSCMTDEKRQRDGFFNDKEMRGHCTHAIIQNDAHATAVSFECSDEGVTSRGTVRFTAISSTSVKGTMDMSMTIHDMPMTTHTEMQSNWISADCGAEK
jgi:hypothetical protein